MSRSGTKDRGAGSPTHLRGGRESSAFCPGSPRHLTENPAEVTCRRCLASLAKLDREFRAKAREHFASRWFVAASGNRYEGPDFDRARFVGTSQQPARDAAHAIAREEGRS